MAAVLPLVPAECRQAARQLPCRAALSSKLWLTEELAKVPVEGGQKLVHGIDI
jgi:hypothetical protein